MADQILIGIDQISKAVGVHADTIIKWRKVYPSFPVRKIANGNLTTTRDKLLTWWHYFLDDALEQYQENFCKPALTTPIQTPVKPKEGGKKGERRGKFSRK
jgi:hypothetical protein